MLQDKLRPAESDLDQPYRAEAPGLPSKEQRRSTHYFDGKGMNRESGLFTGIADFGSPTKPKPRVSIIRSKRFHRRAGGRAQFGYHALAAELRRRDCLLRQGSRL
jgi:hypothetical protein